MSSRTSSRTSPLVEREKTSVNQEDEIRRRAYELYEQRGREDGHELEDWFRAEEEVTQKRNRGVAA